MSITHFTMTLVQQAKSSGGDKYKITGLADDDGKEGKERFIYVPQVISRQADGLPQELVQLTFGEKDGLEFNLVKKGKTGDDRYAPVNEDLWKGDIYLPQTFRQETEALTLSIKPFVPVKPLEAKTPKITTPVRAPKPLTPAQAKPDVKTQPEVEPEPFAEPVADQDQEQPVYEFEFVTDTEVFKVVYLLMIAYTMTMFHYNGDLTMAMRELSQCFVA